MVYYGDITRVWSRMDFAAVQAAHEHFGQLDVIVNNAGYGLFGAIKEVSEAEARAQIETERFSKVLTQEVAAFCIKVTIIEPGGFSTDWSGSSAVHAAPLAEYDSLQNARAARTAGVKSSDPAASSAAILKLVDAENPPLRLLLGTDATQIVPQIYEQRLKDWAEWEDVARVVDGS